MPPRKPPKKPILIVLHQEHSTPGRVGRLLQERGHPLDIRRPRFGDPLPDTMAGHAGAVIFGGPMSANDPDDFIRQEIDWLSLPCARRRRSWACASAPRCWRSISAAGSTPTRRGRAEIGYYPLLPTPDGEAFAREAGTPWPTHVYHWHREGFDCPAGAGTLATGDDFPTQAIRVGPNAFGLQFHPEVTHAMICRWTVRAHERLSLPGAQDRARQIEGRFQYDPHVRLWLDAFLDRWLAGPAPAPIPRPA
jgi:GMP synthase (glutamine-hydrolysing)